jgi:hypothetical protein
MAYPISLRALAAALVLGTAGCATYTPGVRPADGVMLSATDLRALIDRAAAGGRVFDNGYTGGLTYAFRADGGMVVTSRFVTSASFTGSWRIDAEGQRLCTRVERDAETCAHVYRLPAQADRYYVDVAGGSSSANTFRMR